MAKLYEDFFEALGQRESSGNYTIVNRLGYLGKYQVGEAMMDDLGYYNSKDGTNKNDWKGEWTGKNGINSKEDFLNNPKEQEIAIKEEMKLLNRRLKQANLEQYIGKEINGIPVTRSGILASSHLTGIGISEERYYEILKKTGKAPTNIGIRTFLESNGKIGAIDGFGTKASDYLKKFAGYQTKFDKEIDKEALNKPKDPYDQEGLNKLVDKIINEDQPAKYFIWHTEEGSNTCDECLERDGKIFIYGEDDEPPLHPNCNCTIEDYYGEIDEEKMNRKNRIHSQINKLESKIRATGKMINEIKAEFRNDLYNRPPA